MARTTQRTLVPDCPGCYIEGDRVTLVVTVTHPAVKAGKKGNYEQRSEKWPCSKPELRRERDAFKKAKVDEFDRLLDKAQAAQAAQFANAVTLRGAVSRFLCKAYGVTEQEAEDFGEGAVPPRVRDQRKHLLHWCEATDGALPNLGQRDYNSLTSASILFVLKRWSRQTKPVVKPWTIHHRRAALSMFYDTLNGVGGVNPVRGTKWAQPKGLDARGFDYAHVAAILAQVPTVKYQQRPNADGTPGTNGGLTKSKIILEIVCATGLMYAELNRIEPRHLNLKAGTLFTWREKAGKVVGERTLRLIPEALAAFKTFDAENLYGQVPSDRTIARSFALALAKAQAHALATTGQRLPVPDDCRPTDFRHCFGSMFFARTGNERATSEAMGHAPGSRQTARYTRSTVSEVVERATATVAATPLFGTPAAPAARRRKSR